MTQHKIDRKELKHDGLVDAVSQLSIHLHNHARAYVVVAGACVVAAILIGYAAYRSRADREQARAELAAATTVEQLAEFYSSHPDDPEAPVALLRLADELYSQAQYDLALERYRMFVNAYPGGELVDLAGLGVAYCLESRGSYEEALREYTAFPARFQNSAFVPQAIYNSARCLLRLQRPLEASRAYQEVISRYPRSIFAGLSQERLAALSGITAKGNG